MTSVQVQGKAEIQARAGAVPLSLLAIPLKGLVLKALAEGPVGLADLIRMVGLPPQTTLRMHLRTLAEHGILERHQAPDFPGPVECELTPAGRDLLVVARAFEDWLRRSPQAPAPLGSAAAKNAIKALTDGWASTIIRALASRPFALSELGRLINGISYPSLERRLNAMRLNGLIERCSDQGGRARPYELTRWLRQAVVPLVAAARWERKHLQQQTSPIQRIDIETVFLLALPLGSVPTQRSGLCRLAVTGSTGSQARQVGVIVGVDGGSISRCVTRLDTLVDASATGSVAAWTSAVLNRDSSFLEVHGDRLLAAALFDYLNAVLLD